MARGGLTDSLTALAEEADLERVCVDATVVWAHQQAAGVSRGGLRIKLAEADAGRRWKLS